jgi:hypothetical protein
MEKHMTKEWTVESVLDMAKSFQTACVLGAAVDLDLFDAMTEGPQTAAELARKRNADVRGMTVLLDALSALQLITKSADAFQIMPTVAPLLTSTGEKSILAMVQHNANCMRRWVQLARVVKTGRPAPCSPSIRGEEADAASFIGAMHNISGPVAEEIIGAIHPLEFRHLLDVGGASGTWTAAFLNKCPSATATIFDLPHVIPMAAERISKTGLDRRVQTIAGDFMADPLPSGADLAWVSAIVHQNSRTENRQLFAKVHQALADQGRIAIRDILMDETRTKPPAGALFAVNMLVATEGGGTFTFEELKEDLQSVGFRNVCLARRDPQWMHSIVTAVKTTEQCAERKGPASRKANL